MSVWAYTWAFEQPIEKPGAKFVLVALANFADEKGRAYPSQETLSLMTGMTDRAVRTHLAWLEENGYITRLERKDKKGHRTTDLCTFLAPPERLKPQPANISARENPNRKKSTIPTGRNRQSQPEKFSRETSVEPSEETPVSTDSETQAPPASQHTESQKLTNDFYNRLKGRYNITLEKEQYEFHLGHFRNMLTKYEPTEEEQLRVIAYMVDKYPAMPKIRATKAIQDVRLGRDTGEAWSGPAPWEVVPEQDKNSAYAHLDDYTTTTAEERRAIARQILSEV